MKRKLFWRSVLRRPLAAVLIVLLLGAAALGVGEKFTEYSAVSSQVDALNDYYRPIGQLVSTDGDVGAGAELISSSAYVDLSDTRRYVTGVLDGLYNADIDGNSSGYDGSPTGVNVSEILAYAELLSKERIGIRTVKEYDEPRSPYDRIMMDPSVPDGCKARLSLDRNECQLLPLKEAVNLRQKELLSLATKEGRMERKDEWIAEA